MLGGGAGLAMGDVFDGGGVTFDVTVGGASSRGGRVEGEREGVMGFNRICTVTCIVVISLRGGL